MAEVDSPYPSVMYFDSPEEAALAGWAGTPGAAARVVDVTVHRDRAEVVIDTQPAHREWVYCVRTDRGWTEVVSGNGPSMGWKRRRGWRDLE
jgi:hypothetical protein